MVGGCGVVTERTPAARPLDGVRGLPNLSRSRSASGHWPGQGCTAGLPGLPRGPDRRASWFPLPLLQGDRNGSRPPESDPRGSFGGVAADAPANPRAVERGARHRAGEGTHRAPQSRACCPRSGRGRSVGKSTQTARQPKQSTATRSASDTSRRRPMPTSAGV